MGFTGVEFTVDGAKQHRIFSVVMIRVVRNFDFFGFLREVVFASSKNVMQSKTAEEFKFLWKSILAREVYECLGASQNLRDIDLYENDPCGVLGAETVLHPLQTPFKIWNLLLRSLRCDEGLPYPEDLRIVGMPRLSFETADPETQGYIRYLQATLRHLQDCFLKERNDIFTKQAKTKDKEAKEILSSGDLPCPGGWPAQVVGADGQVGHFGLPAFPIICEFYDLYSSDCTESLEKWLSNIGNGEFGQLQQSVVRAYKLGHSSGAVVAGRRSGRLATTDVLYATFYRDCDPLSGIFTEGKLKGYYLSVRDDVEQRRRQGHITPADAFDLKDKYLQARFSFSRACAQHPHTDLAPRRRWPNLPLAFAHTHARPTPQVAEIMSSRNLRNNAFRSDRLLQCAEIMDKVDWDDVVRGESSVHAFVTRACQSLPARRRFDPYQRANHAFWHCWWEVNKDLCMHTLNLQFIIEVMISQLLWCFGRNDSWTYYFHLIMIMSGSGHYRRTIQVPVPPRPSA